MTTKRKRHEIEWNEIERPFCDWGGDLFPSIDPERDANCLEHAEYEISSPDGDFKLCEAHFDQISRFLEDLGIDINDPLA